jgi:hypothetical protein
MPLQNRVTPLGDIVAAPERGLFTGNRGIIHDAQRRTLRRRRWAGRAWLICELSWRGVRRSVMAPRTLVERVREAAAHGAQTSLAALAAAVPVPIAAIAIRVCPTLPPTTEARITDTRAATMADSVMYREALAAAARARGWTVHWYDREHVSREAAAALGRDDIADLLQAMGRSIGPPWQAKHKLAAAAALRASHASPDPTGCSANRGARRRPQC